nr:putative zinc finger protein CONSTANS-LIKE 11 [Ipomoea batatas]
MFPSQLPTPMILSDGIAAARAGATAYDTTNNAVGIHLNMMRPIMDAAISTFPHHHHHHNPLGDVSDQPPTAMLLSPSPPPCGIIGPREFSRTPAPRGGYGCLFESGDECNNGLLDSNFWSLYPMRPPPSYNIEGIHGEAISPKLKEQPAMKIGRYSEEERKDRILRYLKKRNQRNFNKTIKYACRKTLADKRVRVRGRFAKNNEICGDGDGDDDIVIKSRDNIVHHQTKDLYYDHPFQAKQDEEEEWLEEAITSLMYIPYIGGSYDAQFVNFS